MKDIPLESVNTFIRAMPQMAALDISVMELSAGHAVMHLPFSPRLVAYKDTGVMAGGAIFTLLDSVLGMAVFTALDILLPVATLDLRVDYLKPAVTGCEVLASARCTRVTQTIAFVSGVAYLESEDDPLAKASATFIINRPKNEGTTE